MPVSVPGFSAPANNRRSWLRRSSRLAGVALCAAILVACGDGDGDAGTGNAGGVEIPVDTLASFKGQTLNWQACDPSAVEGDEGQLAQLGTRAQCALMRVPLDYANPSSAELQIEVLKVAAEQAQQKRGAIVLNPGGPGVDGLSMAAELSVKLTDADPDAAGEVLKEMSRSYDLVAFSPRGMGRHSPLNCEPTQVQVKDNNFLLDSSAENISNILHNSRVFAENCAANPLTKHIHTDATARDMDLLRIVLGEEKLNYIGYSYGTWLGSWYAGLFPEHVGRMLLDSSVDITAKFNDMSIAKFPAEQRIIDDLLLPEIASDPAMFALGNNADGLKKRLLSFPARLNLALSQHFHLIDRADASRNIFVVAAALKLNELLIQNPDADAADLAQLIDGSPAFTIPQVAEHAKGLSGRLSSTASALPLTKEDYVQWSVMCNDTSSFGTQKNWVDEIKKYALLYPFSFELDIFNPCVFWGGSVTKMPAAAEISKAGPLLMLQSNYDSLTPLDGARKTLDVLPNASMIVVDKEYKHSIFPYGTACVDSQVANYFLYGQVPAARSSNCAAKGL